jgi:GH24 family phage-related lysozyme (muramidase)
MGVPQDILDRIRLREGWKTVVYKDTRGFLTAGTGHKLTADQVMLYPLDSTVPDDVLTAWEESDTLRAYRDGVALAGAIGVNDPNLIEGLTCAAFQLGDHIPTEFPTLWGLLMVHNWEGAAHDAQTTLWDRQTPVRVQDFQNFLAAIPTPSTQADAIT